MAFGSANSALTKKDVVAGTSSATASIPLTVTNGSGQVVGTNNATLQVNNTAPLWNAKSLQGDSVSTTAPSSGQVLTWNGTAWAPATAASTEPWQVITTTNPATGNTQNIYQSGKVGIGAGYSATSSTIGSTLEVNGASTNKSSLNAGTGVAIDFTQSNLAYSTSTSTAPKFNCTGLKDGGTYTLAWQGGTAGTATVSTNMGATKIFNNNQAKSSSQDAVYTIVCIGTTAYVYVTLFNNQ